MRNFKEVFDQIGMKNDKHYRNAMFDLGFTIGDETDETEFTVDGIKTGEEIKAELYEFWLSFCKENNLPPESIEYIEYMGADHYFGLSDRVLVARNIRWDTDDDEDAKEDLPNVIEIPAELYPRADETQDDYLEEISDYLSNETGFCHGGFELAMRICRRCGSAVKRETDPDLSKEYPYYCPECNENMFTFETELVPVSPEVLTKE